MPRRRKTRNPAGVGSVLHRRDGRFVARLTVSGRRLERYARSERLAHAYLDELRAQARLALPPDAGQLVGEYLTRWLAGVRESVKPRTWESYDLNVRRLMPLIGDVPLQSLTPAGIDVAQRTLLDRGLSRRSVQQAHTVLHTALCQAVNRGWLARNPCDAVRSPKPTKTEMVVLSENELRRLFETTVDDPLHALWVLISTSGLRLGEALGLTWADIDWDNARVTVRRQVQRQRGRGVVTAEPKRGRSRRTVELPVGTVAVLDEHRRRQARSQIHELIFCRADGRPFDPGSIRPRLRTATRRARLPDVTVHGLRHTVATVLLTRGVHPKVVQELLGHSTIGITLDTYSHVIPTLHREAARQFDDLFSAKRGNEGVKRGDGGDG